MDFAILNLENDCDAKDSCRMGREGGQKGFFFRLVCGLEKELDLLFTSNFFSQHLPG